MENHTHSVVQARVYVRILLLAMCVPLFVFGILPKWNLLLSAGDAYLYDYYMIS